MSTFNFATNVLTNTNEKRHSFYANIYEYYKNKNNTITYNDLFRIGQEINMGKAHIDDEIIGCLYANFLTETKYQSRIYSITEKAIRNFNILREEGCFQENQVNIKLFFDNGKYNLFMWLVETMSNDFIDNLRLRKWSRNKSKQRLLRKCKTFDEVFCEISYLSNQLSYKKNNKFFKDIIREYGRFWSTLKVYTINVANRDNYSSKTITKYDSFYKKLLSVVGNSIDWGGKEIKIIDFLNIAKSEGITHKNFLLECFNDGMIRYTTESRLTITGHANTVIEKYFDKTKLLDIIIRKTEKSFNVLIGNKTRYSNDVIEHLNLNMKLDEYGWYYSSFDNTKDILDYLRSIALKIDTHTQISINNL